MKLWKLSKKGRKLIQDKIVRALTQAGLGVVTTGIGVVFTILDRFTEFSSIGGIIANAIDWLDRNYNGKIKFYIKVWG